MDVCVVFVVIWNVKWHEGRKDLNSTKMDQREKTPDRKKKTPAQFLWDFWWTMWHWDRLFSKYFGFPPSVSFHRCSSTWKNKKTHVSIHLHHNVAQLVLRLRCARSFCCGTLHKKKGYMNFVLFLSLCALLLKTLWGQLIAVSNECSMEHLSQQLTYDVTNKLNGRKYRDLISGTIRSSVCRSVSLTGKEAYGAMDVEIHSL
jgi:hypothetical protein